MHHESEPERDCDLFGKSSSLGTLDKSWARHLIVAIGSKVEQIKEALMHDGVAELSMQLPDGPITEDTDTFIFLNDRLIDDPNAENRELMGVIALGTPDVVMSYFLNGEVACVIRMILIKAWVMASEELLIRDYGLSLSGLDYQGVAGEIAKMTEPTIPEDC
jgi:hypothetical protein